MNVEYFKKVDSTIVTLSAKLLKTGMRINKATIIIFDRGVRSKDAFDEITRTPDTDFITSEIIHFETSKEKRTTNVGKLKHFLNF